MHEVLGAYVERTEPFPGRAVSVVGLGPGDPGLITVKAAVRLRQAEVVFYDFGDQPWAIWDLVAPGVERTLVPCELPIADIVGLFGNADEIRIRHQNQKPPRNTYLRGDLGVLAADGLFDHLDQHFLPLAKHLFDRYPRHRTPL